MENSLYTTVHPTLKGKIGIKTQQGFSQHTLWLSPIDAKIYTELLGRNGIWYADVTKRD